MRSRVVAVVGPTAAGKSRLGLVLAEALGGEVVNADSMQLYRGMDIGTAKLPPAQRAGIPHHLLDVWDVTEPASVAVYQRLARRCIDGLLGCGVVPVLVGGSGLYVRAALDDFEFPGTDRQLRRRLEAELAMAGSAALHRRLAARDPAAAAGILPSNGRRIVRALEVVELTGSFRATLPAPRSAFDVRFVAVDAVDLDDRIQRRVDEMFAAGLVDEVRRLEGRGLRRGATARRALGYAQMLQMFDGGLKEADVRAEIVRATRRFARRQRSWFRRDPRLHWVTGVPHDDVVAAVRAG